MCLIKHKKTDMAGIKTSRHYEFLIACTTIHALKKIVYVPFKLNKLADWKIILKIWVDIKSLGKK